MTKEEAIDKLYIVANFIGIIGNSVKEKIIEAINTINNTYINVKDDLPCNHNELINPKDKTETIPVLANIGGVIGITKMVKNSHTGGWIWATQVTVYHWMPIPELPKE